MHIYIEWPLNNLLRKTLNKSKVLNFELKARAEMSFYMSKLRILCHGCGQCDSPSEGNHRCDVYRLHQHIQPDSSKIQKLTSIILQNPLWSHLTRKDTYFFRRRDYNITAIDPTLNWGFSGGSTKWINSSFYRAVSAFRWFEKPNLQWE